MYKYFLLIQSHGGEPMRTPSNYNKSQTQDECFTFLHPI